MQNVDASLLVISELFLQFPKENLLFIHIMWIMARICTVDGKAEEIVEILSHNRLLFPNGLQTLLCYIKYFNLKKSSEVSTFIKLQLVLLHTWACSLSIYCPFLITLDLNIPSTKWYVEGSSIKSFCESKETPKFLCDYFDLELFTKLGSNSVIWPSMCILQKNNQTQSLEWPSDCSPDCFHHGRSDDLPLDFQVKMMPLERSS